MEAVANDGEPQRTDVLTFVVKAVAIVPQLIIPLGFVSYSVLDNGIPPQLIYMVLFVIAVLSMILVSAWLQWSRFTYRIGEADIRVESGILSRTARSVPYERIQDVSLEQKLVPRLLGLVSVKFETGAGGKDELALAYLSEEQGEALRELVRERRDEAVGDVTVGVDTSEEMKPREHAEVLFAMEPKRLFTFGLFEFSLAVFAVLGGLAQYAETFIGLEVWDPDLWVGWFAGPSNWFAELGVAAQVISAIAGLITLLIVGSVTGVARTVLRDWNFLLEKTAKGFRRRRGLLTRTDVVMPAHRVQALTIATGLIRRRFGWHGLSFVSLAQDAGSASHVVAPFAQQEELEPIIRAAGFEAPSLSLDWRRSSKNHRTVSMILEGGLLALATLGVLALVILGHSDTFGGRGYFALIPAGVGAFLVARQYYLWRFARNAIDSTQVYRRSGWFAPSTAIANRVKLQSVEIKQGPLGRWLGYADLHLGLAGGKFAIEGLPVERARTLRRAILDSIGKTDFSELNR